MDTTGKHHTPIRVLITAGPTYEPIDAVRFIGNRSSGRLGVALADEAARSANVSSVTLLLGTGASAQPTHPNVQTHRFTSSADLTQLLDEHFAQCDLLIMAAAVADYRPVTVKDHKLERSNDATSRLQLELEPTPDLVAGIAKSKRPSQQIIAFALEEPSQLIDRATRKMQRKGVDGIVANPLDTMDSGEIDATLLLANGSRESPGQLSKLEFAAWLIRQLTLR